MTAAKHKKQELFLKAIQATKGPNGDNLIPKPMSDAEFRELIIAYFLGENWYVALSMTQEQSNSEAAYEIIARYLGN